MLNIIEDSQYKEGLSMETLGELIPKNKITLLHGRSGSGKTLSILKYFEELNLSTILLDFDTNDGITKLVDTVHLDGFSFWNNLHKGMTSEDKDTIKEQLKGKIFIIDTYAKCNNYIKDKTDNKHDIHTLAKFLEECQSTVVVIAHTIYYSGKDAHPDVDVVWANHLGCKLHLHRDILKTKTNVYLEVEKLRGYKGEDVISNWMRG